VKIPAASCARAKGGAEHTLIDFIGEVKDETTSPWPMCGQGDIKLSGATAAHWRSSRSNTHRVHPAAGNLQLEVSGARRRNGGSGLI